MSLFRHGAQRASRRPARALALTGLAVAFAATALFAGARPTIAAGKKVVIVVGPAGSSTSNYIYNAKKLATQARGYGATVYEIYSPYATWSKVKTVAQGANVLIYLGHGNGWPSPYGPYQSYTKDGIGLNSTSGNGNYNVKYWGEYYIARDINLAPKAVVLLNRLCYASGNSEPGYSDPTRTVARQRVDNYGAGFLRANANVVMAEGISNLGYALYGLFKTNRTMLQIFYSSSAATHDYAFSFTSARTSGVIGALDPYKPGKYYRSIVGYNRLTMTAGTWRSG